MPADNRVAEQIETVLTSLAREVEGADDVVVRIPGWEPVALGQGLHWMRASLAEGFYVASRVEWNDRKATVWMKIWEYGELEPEWEA